MAEPGSDRGRPCAEVGWPVTVLFGLQSHADRLVEPSRVLRVDTSEGDDCERTSRGSRTVTAPRCRPTRRYVRAASSYVHGYEERDTRRLAGQAETLVELLHHDSTFPEGATILEAGCGVGAQTVTLAALNASARITSVDVSAASLELAAERCSQAAITNVTFEQADIFDLPYEPASFDHVFVCFVLEHLADPVGALRALQRVVRPGGTITLIEGFTRNTFTAMIEGVRHAALAAGLIDADRFDHGIRDLYRAASIDGVFWYMFIKAVAHTAPPDAPVTATG